MINPEQIRAARAFLDWSTADLAKQAGLTVNGINKIERGHVEPQKETLEALQRVFELAGLEFMPNSGIKKKERIVQILEGANAIQGLFDDIISTLQDSGGDVLITGGDAGYFVEAVGKEALEAHIIKLLRFNIRERLLYKHGYISPFNHPKNYHWIPEKYFSPHSLYIYGPKLALACCQTPQKVIIINDERFAESLRKIFEFVWDHTKPPRY